jgi:multiple sugar transport system substrate-binding protein
LLRKVVKSLLALPRTTILILRHRRDATSAPWADLIKARGRQVNYSIIQSTFHQIVADAFQRMVLRNTSAEDAYQEAVTKYNEALAKTK